ncbi:SMI1/KNR4 family protein [Pseudomonas marginalis]|uniref:SMI1/KNR4 family protein n=1 Tax=Pseudomonas marginalis TaxID=298 RepID=UPI002033D1E4|nr:SMI1/KNR4 family protein [Pseudomonas marginalis]MCM2380913.1 SMI1/KNR4 family protein [Pseudomonas marginalis]
MKGASEVGVLIREIVSSALYEGDYGRRISNHELVLGGVEVLDRVGVPLDYLEFLEQFGFGELDSALYIEDGPTKYSVVTGCDVVAYRNMYVFASTGSGVFYAFDVANDWSIVEIDPELNDAEVSYKDFSSFILSQLTAIKVYVDWRAQQ